MKKYRWLFILFLLVAVAFNYSPNLLVNARPNGLSSLQLNHVEINVPNYEETIAWYEDKFDATIEQEWTVDEFPSLQLAYINVYGTRIEIVGTAQSKVGMPQMSDFDELFKTTGIGHFCFGVDSVDDAIAELDRRGVPTFIEAFDAPQTGVRVGFVKDNNGNVIEFSEPLAS